MERLVEDRRACKMYRNVNCEAVGVNRGRKGMNPQDAFDKFPTSENVRVVCLSGLGLRELRTKEL